MKHNPHALVNVQALSEPQRAEHRRKVYSCCKAGMTKYAAAKKCRVQTTTVGRWYGRFDAAGEEAYVRRAYGMSISRPTARRYMQKMGFTCQCLVKAAREQNKGARAFPGRGLACPCRAGKQVGQVQHDFRCQQQGRNAVHGLRRGDERRHLQGIS